MSPGETSKYTILSRIFMAIPDGSIRPIFLKKDGTISRGHHKPPRAHSKFATNMATPSAPSSLLKLRASNTEREEIVKENIKYIR